MNHQVLDRLTLTASSNEALTHHIEELQGVKYIVLQSPDLRSDNVVQMIEFSMCPGWH